MCPSPASKKQIRGEMLGPPTQGLSLQRPHLLRGGRQEAFQALNDGTEVWNQQLFGSAGWETETVQLKAKKQKTNLTLKRR